MGEKLIIHVSVDGCDGWSGTIAAPNTNGTDGPLRSLAGARDRIRLIRKAGRLMGPVEVIVHKGIYEMVEMLHFQEDDLGDENTSVTFRSAGDGDVNITGGVILKGFVKYHGEIFKLDLKAAGFSGLRFKQLFFIGVRQHMSRYPNFTPENPYGAGWLYVDGPVVDFCDDGHGKKDRFICHDPRLKAWKRIREVEIFIYPRYNWTNDIVRLKSYDPETGEVVLDNPCVYEIYPGDRFYFRNVAEELDSPGEWYLDEENDVLYFYPPEGYDGEIEVSVPMVENIIEVHGQKPPEENLYTEKIDWTDSGSKLWVVERYNYVIEKGYINFEDICFEVCDGAAAVIRNVKCVGFKGCTIRNTGGAGIIVLEGKNCGVYDSDIYDTGSHGIYMSGGTRSPFCGIYEGCGHTAENNYIHHVGAFYKSVAGVAVNGVGIKVAHNLIHDGPRWGILSRGNDNILEYNHIRHVNIETSDTAAIYLVDRDLTMRGTKIRYNRIHDVLGYHRIDGVWCSPAYAFGIYLDDYTSGVEIYGNLIYRTPDGAVFIHSGQDNMVENNILLETRSEMAFFRRCEREREYKQLGTWDIGLRRNIFRKNILASTVKQSNVYKFENTLDDDNQVDINSNVLENNIIWHYGQPLNVLLTLISHEPYKNIDFVDWQNMGFDRGSVVADPMFEDIENDDYRLKEGSPALSLGFVQLPIEAMGLYDSGKRAS